MLPKWCTPERQRQMVEIFQWTHGLCVYGHPQCPVEAHCYEAYLDEQLIPDWVSMDALERAWQWKVEQRRMHTIPDRKGWNNSYKLIGSKLRHRGPITMEQWRDAQPLFEIMGYSVNPLTMHKTALVRIPGAPVRLLVDVERVVFPSKRQLRRARRTGERFPSVVEVCKAAVLDWKARH